jgi:Aromatic-ring-opening dioxygenase LigAB, LigA subunit
MHATTIDLEIEKVLASLISDASYREAFQRDRTAAVTRLGLSPETARALLDLDVESLAAAGTSVRGRLLRTLDY